MKMGITRLINMQRGMAFSMTMMRLSRAKTGHSLDKSGWKKDDTEE
jgi:hypothetical protein